MMMLVYEKKMQQPTSKLMLFINKYQLFMYNKKLYIYTLDVVFRQFARFLEDSVAVVYGLKGL